MSINAVSARVVVEVIAELGNAERVLAKEGYQ